MKRLKSYGDDLDSAGEKGVFKDWGRRDQDFDRSSSHRRFYSKSENLRKGLSCSSSSYDRSLDDDRESSRSSRKRFDHDSDSFDRRKNFDRYRDCSDRGISISSPRNAYNVERIHRSDSFSGIRREFPKGLRSERERSRREESVSSWRRLSSSKDADEDPRNGVDSSRGSRVMPEDKVNRRSPQGSRDAVKSPQFSKESSCEQSKSAELKKPGEVQRESGNSSEMEEGELEPETDATPESEPVTRPETPLGVNSENQKVFESENQVESERNLEKEAALLSGENLELNGGEVSVTVEAKEMIKLPDCLDNSIDGLDGNEDKAAVVNDGGKDDVSLKEDLEVLSSPDHKHCTPDKLEAVEELNDNLSPVVDRQKDEKSTALEVMGDGINLETEKAEENITNVSLTLTMDKPTQNGKDKGKSLAVSPPTEAYSVEDGPWMERDSETFRDDSIEGPSRRGFELFFSPVLTRGEKSNSCSSKHKEEKLKIEPLELSLGLPNVSLPLVSSDPDLAPSSYSLARSVQSLPNTLRTSSDASLSGSHTFIHNPSCSLTQNSFDNYEQSVGSHPIFQGIDQASHGTFSNEFKHKEVPLYQRILLSGNGTHHASQMSPGFLNFQPLDGQRHLKVSQRSTGAPASLNRHPSLSRQLSGKQLRQHDEVRSPTQSNGSSETRSECSIDKRRLIRERSGSSLFRSNSQREMEQIVIGGTGFVEGFITMIVSEPIQVMSSRLCEMTEQSVTCLKESACEIIMKEHKHVQLLAFQKKLQDRSDITFDALSKSHRAQLEILTAFKTGLSDFLRRAGDIPSSNLIEIFLNRRCRNVTCQSLLPVDECDCKVCVQKIGFCSACMCLVCSKFDMASNTCSWVGCDVCLHWCHTNCGLKESFIRNGRSATEAQATTEMQFHCVACNHPSEMFGFVKEVFRTCAKDWKAETLSKELKYVKRIFSASNDSRGKQLHDLAEQMLARLEDKSSLPEVYNRVMELLNESDSKLGNTSTFSIKEPALKNPEGNSMIVASSHDTTLLASVSAEKSPCLENVGSARPSLDWNQVGRCSGNPELQINAERKPFVDELESIVRIKQAEAKMFQSRADDARREADGLKRIAIAKNAKIEEEYMSRVARLNLVEAEERRRQKLEELQALERAYHEYLSMKMRMEGDIKDMLLRMEATRRNLNA